MLREFNYTGRRKILREHINIHVKQDESGNISFSAKLDLTEYEFEKITPEPRVFVEAYRGATATWKRFSFGGVRSIAPPDDLFLNEFRVPEGILFRVRVTSFEPGSPGKLLAEADALRARSLGDTDGFVEPLIQHMATDDIGQELWRIHYSDDLPILKINDKIAIGVEQFLTSPTFRSIYAPCVMRQVLQRILLIELFSADEDESNWKQRWVQFATRLSGGARRNTLKTKTLKKSKSGSMTQLKRFANHQNH